MARPVSQTRRTFYNLPGLGTTAQFSDVKAGFTDGDFVTPLAYQRRYGVGKAGLNQYGSYFADDADSTGTEVRLDSSRWQPIRNKAYSRLVDDIHGTRSQLGTSFAEWRESYGMIANRAMGLRKAYTSLRRGNFKRALKELSVDPKRKHRNKARNAANEASGLWLEYWFGWSPFLNDMYESVQQLDQPFPSGERFQGSATGYLESGTRTSTSWNVCFNKATFRTGARVRLINPNLFLLNSLGLVNPLAVAWEVVPFSFMVDWVSDVSTYLESFTDFAGLEVSRAYNNGRLITSKSRGHVRDPREATLAQVRFERKPGVLYPLPNLGVLMNLGQSKTRAVTAVSLLTQVLKT